MKNVYKDEYGHLYSDGVTRDFGENRMIKSVEFGDVFSSIQPLKVDPKAHGLKKIGTIK